MADNATQSAPGPAESSSPLKDFVGNFLKGNLGEVDTEVSISDTVLFKIGATVVLAALIIMLAHAIIKNLSK